MSGLAGLVAAARVHGQTCRHCRVTFRSATAPGALMLLAAHQRAAHGGAR